VDDGKAGLIYNNLNGDGTAFSPDGQHFAYIAVAERGQGAAPAAGPNALQPQTWRVVLDGVEQELHFLNISKPIFSKDSKHLGYIAGVDGFTPTRAVFDGKSSPAYEFVEKLVISDDGSRYAYVGRKRNQNDVKNFVVDNGKELPPYSSITYLAVSPDGKRLAYTAINTTGQPTVIDDGKPGLQYQTAENLQFTPDSTTLLYIATSSAGQFVVANGQEIGPFTQVNRVFAFSPDGQHWATWTQQTAGGWAVVEDGKTIPLNPGVSPGTLAFQEGTGRLFMKSTTSSMGAPAMVEIGAAPVDAQSVPGEITFSPNRQHRVTVTTANFGGSQATQQVAIDGNPPQPQRYQLVQKAAISDDGKHVAFVGARADAAPGSLTHAFFDGKEGPSYNTIWDLVLSPDGQHVAYVAQDGPGSTGNWYVVVDGMKGPPFQDVLPYTSYQAGDHRLIFDPDGSLRFLAFFDGQLHRCVYPPDAFKSMPTMAAAEADKPGLKELHKFTEAPGVAAIRFMIAPDETIYGLSAGDGKFKKGTLFSLKTDGSGFTVLHDFFGGDADGEHPLSLIIEPDGKLLGVLDAGKVFRYDPKSQQYGLIEITKRDYGPNYVVGYSADGKIIGMGGGTAGQFRDLFAMAPDGSGYTTVDNSQFAKPPKLYAQIVPAADGGFFAVSPPALVKFKNLTDPATVVHKFVNSPNDGSNPNSDLALDSKGNLYGSTHAGGMSQQGIIYRVDADGSNYKVVYNPDKFEFTRVFAASDDGKLYGIAKEGLIAISADGSSKSPETVFAFDGSPHLLFRGFSNVFVHGGAFYGLSNRMIYKIPLAMPTAAPGAAAPAVAMQAKQAQAGPSIAVTFGEPAGTAAAVGAPPTQQQQAPAQQQTTSAQQNTQTNQARGNTPTTKPAPPNQSQSALDKAAAEEKKAKDTANKIKGLFGRQ
jgi:uncharacterized repeat protein (TIGR03803 family)